MNKSDWVVGRKYRFIGGDSPSGFHTGFWTVGKVYEMVMEPSWYDAHQDDELSPDSLFKDDDGDENYMDLCCFEPVKEGEKEMKFNENVWKPGLKVRFVGGPSNYSMSDDLWTVGKIYTQLSEVKTYAGNVPDAVFSCDGEEGMRNDLACFEPVSPSLYVVGMQRKSDGKIFLSDSPKNPYEDFEKAKSDVERWARNNSDSYVYFVYELLPVMSAELDSPPVKKNWFK